MVKRKNGRPRIACEVTANRVVAARVNPEMDAVEAIQSRTFAAGAVVPSLVGINVAQQEALREAISGALADVTARGREIIAILPDAAVRIALLDFDSLPDRKQDADSVVRFRLKKALPFDVEKAGLSYDVQRTGKTVRVVAAVTQASVLQEYEEAFRAAGYNPGFVMPSTLAALGAVDGSKPTLVLNVESDTTSVAVLDQDQLLLFRTLENSGGANITGERLADDIYPSIVFFQDTYGVNVERVLVAGVVDLHNVAPALEMQTGARVQELVTSSQLGVSAGTVQRSELAGVVGALIG
jgi:type IV pilus assembly protein PilM